MLKEIFASILLSTSIATPSSKVVPLRANEQSQVAINGYYNFKDEMEWPNQYGSFYVKQTTDDIEMYVYYANYYNLVNEFKVTYSFQNPPNYLIRIDITYYSEDDDTTRTEVWTSSGTNGGYTYLSNYSTEFKEMILYFPSTFYYTETRNNAFSNFFTTLNNAYITSYNGYFNFALNYSSTDLDLRGTFIIDNNLYYEVLDRDNGNLYGYYYDYVEGNRVFKYKRIFGSNVAPKNRNIFMQVSKLPNSQRDMLNQVGVFAYVQPEVQSYTFGEFFFSILDAPIYYLSSLFSFELFGVNMFMALTSLLTLAILVLVIKKVI